MWQGHVQSCQQTIHNPQQIFRTYANHKLCKLSRNVQACCNRQVRSAARVIAYPLTGVITWDLHGGSVKFWKFNVGTDNQKPSSLLHRLSRVKPRSLI